MGRRWRKESESKKVTDGKTVGATRSAHFMYLSRKSMTVFQVGV
jgi:hypothetical protein